MDAFPKLRIREAAVFERRLSMRLPFRFGAATVTEASQIFLKLLVEDAGGRVSHGYAAELMVPKWFDKNPELTNADNENQLRRSLDIALDLVKRAAPASAFGLHAALEPAQHDVAASEGLNGLIASFGLALLDRAVLDGLCRLSDLPVAEIIRLNLPGIDASTTPDLAAFDIPGFLATLQPQRSLFLRHTVGYADALTPDGIKGERLDDGLPECLSEEIATYELSHFKIKISGQSKADVERLKAVGSILDGLPAYHATLDGNEQFENEAHVADFWSDVEAEPALARLRASLLFIEQPIARGVALSSSVSTLAARVALEIDESDGEKDAFLKAKQQGYKGVSSKSCKGFYRAFLNRMRVEQWNAQGAGGFFMSAEDLTTQAGIALQQDLALAGLLGLGHIERNGHHYVNGMSGAGPDESRAWLDAHSDLYREAAGRPRLAVQGGKISLGSVLSVSGLGVAGTAAEATFHNLQIRGHQS
jgi:L-alanine-DL-glutamate epimerase-like enolase superfamily enzyme